MYKYIFRGQVYYVTPFFIHGMNIWIPLKLNISHISTNSKENCKGADLLPKFGAVLGILDQVHGHLISTNTLCILIIWGPFSYPNGFEISGLDCIFLSRKGFFSGFAKTCSFKDGFEISSFDARYFNYSNLWGSKTRKKQVFFLCSLDSACTCTVFDYAIWP